MYPYSTDYLQPSLGGAWGYAYNLVDVVAALELLGGCITTADCPLVPMSRALLVFSKAPEAGTAKTRLIPALGALGAAQLQQKMTEWVVTEAAASSLGPVTLCCAPDCNHSTFSELQQRFKIELQPQHGEDVGERMHKAIEGTLQLHDTVILMGSDCPQIDRSLLATVADTLEQHDVVIVPAEDGGYVLIATRVPVATVFQGITWGTDRVMEQTIGVLQQQQLNWYALPPLVDIDRPEDLQFIPKGWLDE